MKKIINYDEISLHTSLISCSIVGHPKSGKASLLNYITKSFNHVSRLNKINIIYRNALINNISHSFVTCLTSLQTSLGQISVLQISQICIFVISINFSEYIQYILETLMCIECCKIYFCLICITNTELYDIKYVESNLKKLKKIINLSCNFKFLIINPIFGHNMNNFNNIINFYSKQYWIENPIIFNKKTYFTIIRSYDLTSNNDIITGGIVGGYIKNGFIKKNSNIYIKPGLISKNNDNVFYIKSKITNIQVDKNPVNYCLPKGITGLELSIDPYFTTENKLRGHMLGNYANLPPTYKKIGFKFNGLKKILLNTPIQKEVIMNSLSINESIILCINSIFINGIIIKCFNNNSFIMKLTTPKCIDLDNTAVVFRKVNFTWMVSGFAKNLFGDSIDNQDISYEIPNNGNFDSITITFSQKNQLCYDNFNPIFIKKNINSLEICCKNLDKKVLLSYNFNYYLNIPQYSKFKFRNNQIEIALKKLNILHTINDKYIEINISYKEYIDNYSKKIKDVFKCKKCYSYTFMFYKKTSIHLQICSHCGFYSII